VLVLALALALLVLCGNLQADPAPCFVAQGGLYAAHLDGCVSLGNAM
jgi:hypothetical protein